MCKCENVQMCKWSPFLAAISIVMLYINSHIFVLAKYFHISQSFAHSHIFTFPHFPAFAHSHISPAFTHLSSFAHLHILTFAHLTHVFSRFIWRSGLRMFAAYTA